MRASLILFLADECKYYLASLDDMLSCEFVDSEILPTGCLVKETRHEGTELTSYDGIFNYRRTEQECTFSSGDVFCVYKVTNIFNVCQIMEDKIENSWSDMICLVLDMHVMSSILGLGVLSMLSIYLVLKKFGCSLKMRSVY